VPEANNRLNAQAHVHVPDLLVDMASAFAGSRVSQSAALFWALLTGGIALAGAVIGIVVAVR